MLVIVHVLKIPQKIAVKMQKFRFFPEKIALNFDKNCAKLEIFIFTE